MNARLVNSGPLSVRTACADSLGIVLRSQRDVAEALTAGRLERVMAEWEFGAAPVVVLVPTRKGHSARAQALVSILVEAADSPRQEK